MASFSSATATALASLPAFFFFIFGSSMSKLFWWGGTLLTYTLPTSVGVQRDRGLHAPRRSVFVCAGFSLHAQGRSGDEDAWHLAHLGQCAVMSHTMLT